MSKWVSFESVLTDRNRGRQTQYHEINHLYTSKKEANTTKYALSASCSIQLIDQMPLFFRKPEKLVRQMLT